MQTGVRLILEPLLSPNSSAKTTSPGAVSPPGSQTSNTARTVSIIAKIAMLLNELAL